MKKNITSAILGILLAVIAVGRTGATAVYFTDPVISSNQARDQVINFINSSTTTLDAAIYSFTYDISGSTLLQIAGALQSAKNRGVAVRLVTTGDNLTGAQYNILDLLSDGSLNGVISNSVVRYRPVDGYINHNKFIVADGNRVLTGSTNWTYSGFYQQENNVIILHGAVLAGYYATKFNQMWNGIYGVNGSNRYPRNGTTDDGYPVEVWFGPDDDLTWRITSAMDSATSNVYFLINTFSTGTKADAIGAAIQRAADRGLDVRGVFDTSTDQWYNLVNYPGVSVSDYIGPRILHDKLVIVDYNTASGKVLSGSNNWTTSADQNNDENMVVFSSAPFVNSYIDHFRTIYFERSSTAGGSTPVRRFGDYNGDNQLTIDDYNIAVAIAGGQTPTPYQLLAGDMAPTTGVNGHLYGDGVIDQQDVDWLATRLGLIIGTDKLAEIHQDPDGTGVVTEPMTVTASLGTVSYIQSDDRAVGIRVQGATIASGSRVCISGTMASLNGGNGERYISTTSGNVSTISTGNPLPQPLSMTNRALGGANRADGPSKGIHGATGLYNIGLRVKCFGKVTVWTPASFYIDDGSGIMDGSGNTGIKVLSASLARPAVGSYVSVTGISTMEQIGGLNVRQLRPVVQSDIVVISGP